MGYRKKTLSKTKKKNWGWIECPYSNKSYREDDMDADHIWPKKYGGTDHSFNLVMAGKSENRSKGAKIDRRVIKGYYHNIKSSV